METCFGCAFSAGAAALMFVVFRSIAWWASRARTRAMARVEREAA
ncbi:MAG: hypothetical protein AMXMBFR56_15700 [Polyangiaceae bacterium]